MRERSILEQLAEQARPEMLIGAGAALVLLVAVSGYLYAIKPPLVEYRELARVREGASTRLDAEAQAVDPVEIAALERRVAGDRDRLYGTAAGVSARQMESHVIDSLDRISVRHDVALASVRPGDSGEVLMFDELPYDVAVEGSYFQLFEWFRDVETSLRPMVVKRFSMAAGRADEARISMQLRLVAYRPAEERS